MKLSRSTLSTIIGIVFAFFCMASVAAGYALFRAIRPRTPERTAAHATDQPVPTSGIQATPPAPGDDLTPTPFQIPSGVCGGPGRLNILLLGLDNRTHDYASAVRSDSISVISVDHAAPSASMLGIPRDLWVAIPGVAGVPEDRVNTAYAYGEGHDLPGGGPALAMQTVTLNFGIRLERYLVVDFSAFVQAVDSVGGIDIDVPVAIYDDRFPAEDDVNVMLFQVPAGRQHMDGITALRYARTRHQDSDFYRIRRQQAVMFALLDKVLTPQVLPQLPGLIQTLYGTVRTNLSLTELAGLACVGQSTDRSTIRSYVIDANYVIPWTTAAGAAVQIPDRDAIAPIVAEFNGR